MCYISTTTFCSNCNQHDETVQHLFSNCNEVISLWIFFANGVKLIAYSQIVILVNTNTDDRYFITENLILILLIFKFYVYKLRGSAT